VAALPLLELFLLLICLSLPLLVLLVCLLMHGEEEKLLS
jgi:hypothetical protein